MRLLLMILFTLIAFAANSVLNRGALVDGSTGPMAYSVVRLLSGALVLWVLVAVQNGFWRPRLHPVSAIALTTYIISFSIAYVTLDAGLGALILFGGVQLTMFILALFVREKVRWPAYVGAFVSFGGLCVLFLPSAELHIDVVSVGIMICGAMGWGAYSFIGKGSSDPMVETAQNFVWALPLAVIAFSLSPDAITIYGATLGVMSGAVTSSIGYALWYSILPKLRTSSAAVLQLSVPILASVAGIIFLDEFFTWQLGIATILVITGTCITLRRG